MDTGNSRPGAGVENCIYRWKYCSRFSRLMLNRWTFIRDLASLWDVGSAVWKTKVLVKIPILLKGKLLPFCVVVQIFLYNVHPPPMTKTYIHKLPTFKASLIKQRMRHLSTLLTMSVWILVEKQLLDTSILSVTVGLYGVFHSNNCLSVPWKLCGCLHIFERSVLFFFMQILYTWKFKHGGKFRFYQDKSRCVCETLHVCPLEQWSLKSYF